MKTALPDHHRKGCFYIMESFSDGRQHCRTAKLQNQACVKKVCQLIAVITKRFARNGNPAHAEIIIVKLYPFARAVEAAEETVSGVIQQLILWHKPLKDFIQM